MAHRDRSPWSNDDLNLLLDTMEDFPSLNSIDRQKLMERYGFTRSAEAVRRRVKEVRGGTAWYPPDFERKRLLGASKKAPLQASLLSLTAKLPEEVDIKPKLVINKDIYERLEAMLIDEERGRLDSPVEEDPIRIELPPNRQFLIWNTSDWHVPDHSLHHTASFLYALADVKPDFLILNGDMVDNVAFGTFIQAQKARGPGETDIPVMKKLLQEIRDAVGPDCRIIYRPGNHEDRVIRDHVAMVRGLPMYGWQYWLDLESFGVEWIPYKQDIELGPIQITHGEFTRQGAGTTVLKKYIEKDGYQNVLIGHCHRLAMVGKTYRDRIVWGIEAGGLCDPKKMGGYMRGVKDWQHGFGSVVVRGEDSYPQAVLMREDGSFAYNNKIYTPYGIL